jgi:uncharacterized protein YbjT (DUF2867 family)
VSARAGGDRHQAGENTMTVRPTTVLVVGATGSIGRLVVEEAIRYGYATRALVRDPAKARILPPEADVVVGDVTLSRDALARCGRSGRRGVHARVGRRGQGWGGKGRLRRRAQRLERSRLADREIALMTSIGVTNRTGTYNRATEAHDWKRRSERLMRASGLPYTIVRPAGSTTAVRTSTGSSSSRVTAARPAIPATVSSRDARSPRS